MLSYHDWYYPKNCNCRKHHMLIPGTLVLWRRHQMETFSALLAFCEVDSQHKGQWRGALMFSLTLEWRHNGLDSVSNHQPHDCLLNRLFRRTSKKTSKLRVTGLCEKNSPGTGQMASNAENVPFDDVIMNLHLSKRLSKQWTSYWRQWIKSTLHHLVTRVYRNEKQIFFPRMPKYFAWFHWWFKVILHVQKKCHRYKWSKWNIK